MSRIINHSDQPAKRSLVNVDRFMKRNAAAIREALRQKISDEGNGFTDILKSREITLKTLRQPSFHLDASTGDKLYVIPGNTVFVPGDVIPQPPSASGKGQGGDQGGDGEDDFKFDLSEEMARDIFFEDMELPDLVKKQLADMTSPEWKRAGYKSQGSPNMLAIGPTARKALMRRNALGRPKRPELREAEEKLADLEAKDILTAEEQAECVKLRHRIAVMKRKRSAIPFMDTQDLRYRRFEIQPRPVAQAVMFCLMDVSGSMTEHMKDLAKRFYMLLYVFLTRRYRHVEIVFIRHTDRAEEVDEETFFHGPASGGTMVSSALQAMHDIVRSRFRPSDWNIYAAQASDGDNSISDSALTGRLLTENILPVSQFFAYLEVGEASGSTFEMPDSSLWTLYQRLRSEGAPLSMRKVSNRSEIFPVFHDLFQRRRNQEKAAP